MARMVMLFFAGGINDFLNYPRYKNDILLVAQALLLYQGSSLDDLHILYAAGGDTFDFPGGQIVAKPANRETLRTLLSKISEDLTSADTFFFLATNHGALSDEFSHVVGLYGWDEDIIENREFAQWCETLEPEVQIYVFGQCYSGGFLEPLANHQRIVMAACQWNEVSYQSSNDEEYDEFILRFAEAIQAGTQTYKDVFDTANSRDQEDEIPQFSDPGNLGVKTILIPIAKEPCTS